MSSRRANNCVCAHFPRRTDISVNRTTDTQAEAKHSELSLETPDELPLGTADELPLEIPDGPSRSDRQAVGRAHADLNFTDVEYFANRYSAFLKFTPKELDALFDEFADYQLLESADISGDLIKESSQSTLSSGGRRRRKEGGISTY